MLTDTLAALGRGHLSSVRQTVGRRLETGGADTQRLTVAGQAFGPEAWDRVGSGSLAQTHDLLFRAATLQQRPGAAAAPGPRTALSDAARTYTGVPVLIDVLANDGDLDGLRIVAVTAPAHGTTAVAEGVVRYAPAPGHRGRDTFTYTLVDEDGRTARATVSVMVVG